MLKFKSIFVQFLFLFNKYVLVSLVKMTLFVSHLSVYEHV